MPAYELNITQKEPENITAEEHKLRIADALSAFSLLLEKAPDSGAGKGQDAARDALLNWASCDRGL